MMKVDFHHLFCFCAEGAPEADHLVNAGFIEGPRNTHKGQGTANRRFFFQNGMLEFLWVTNLNEIRSDLTGRTRLYDRSEYKKTGFSPFGIAMYNATLDGKPLDRPFSGWAYKPNYLPDDLEIWVADNEDHPAEPMLFYASFFSKFDGGSLDRHANNVNVITSINVQMTGNDSRKSNALDLSSKMDLLKYHFGKDPLAVIEFDHNRKKLELDLRQHSLPIVLNY